MPYRTFVITHLTDSGHEIQDVAYKLNWARSDRFPDGRLMIRDNGVVHEEWKVLRWMPGGIQAAFLLPTSADPNLGWNHPSVMPIANRLDARTYGRFRGKLYKGSAALGVTLASWKQSQEMITSAYRSIGWGLDSMSRTIDELQRTARRGQYERLAKRLASKHLEVVFGWQPLVQDILAAATTVINDQPKAQRVSVRASAQIDTFDVYGDEGYAKMYSTGYGFLKCARSATIEITNPNLWLAERAGLLNGAAVAWDLVPWSFVVNMFVNTGQLVNSITDFAGLSFPSSSITWGLPYGYTIVSAPGSRNGDPRRNELYGKAIYRVKSKYRTLNGVARPPLITKLPDVNWELAAIAASLATQKFRKVSGFIQSNLFSK